MCQTAALFWNKHGKKYCYYYYDIKTRAFVNDKSEKEHKIPPAYLLNVPTNKKKLLLLQFIAFLL